MSILAAKTAIEGDFYTNWTTTSIQYQGLTFSGTGVTKWIGLKFVPVDNELYAFDGTTTGRIEYNSQMQVFCYDISPAKAIALADAVCTFLNGKRYNPDVVVGIGSAQGSPIDLETGVWSQLVTFEVNNYG